HWKELSDSVENAQRLFVIRNDTRKLAQLILEQSAKSTNQSNNQISIHEELTLETYFPDVGTVVYLPQARARLDNILGLKEELPYDSARENVFHKVEFELANREKEDVMISRMALFEQELTKRNLPVPALPHRKQDTYSDFNFERRLDELERGVV